MQKRTLSGVVLALACVMGFVLSAHAADTPMRASAWPAQAAKAKSRGAAAGRGTPASVYALKTVVTGTVNGTDIDGSGEGVADVMTGEAKLDYVFKKLSNPNYYNIVAPLMSYLSNGISRTVEGGENPFRDTGVSFSRTIIFSEGGEKLNINTRYERVGRVYNAVYEVKGNIPNVDVTGADQSIEDLIQGKDDQVFGVASQTWSTKEGSRLRAIVTTTYTTVEGERWAPMTTANKRFVTTQLVSEGENKYIYAQQATIFANLPGHVGENRTLPQSFSGQ